MKKYNYYEAVKKDVIDFIIESDILEYDYKDISELVELLSNELWDKDVVVGNGEYGYLIGPDRNTTYEEYISTNLKLVFEALEEFGNSFKDLPTDYDELLQYLDTSVRCYILDNCIYEALNDMGIKDDN